MKRTLQKLRKASLDEIVVRGTQFLSAFAERQAWSRPAVLMSDDELLQRMDPARLPTSQRIWPRFFAAFESPAATVGEIRRRWPESEAATIAAAERILKGRFDLLGFRDLSFGTPVNWHLEPIAGKCSPREHWSRLDYLDVDIVGDKKITWELNRHQYFLILGQAYWFTGDERYAQTFAAHVNSWMDQNPPKLGINWASSLEVAFRSISWLWALYFFRHSAAVTPELLTRMWKFFYVNARHLETYPSTYFSPNTHLTGEALGLFYLGTLLPEFKEANRWRDHGLRTLLGQLSRHVQPDGVYFEQASYYHRYTTDFYLHLRVLLGIEGHSIPLELNAKLQLLLDHLEQITRPDGTTPLFGDDDGGRFLPLESRPANDFRSTLATGAAVFERADYKFVSGGACPETLWLLGTVGVEMLDRLQEQEPAHQSQAFPSGGYYVLRDGWKPDSNYMLFDCGPHGHDNCGHAHADALSFELSVNGRTLLVDPGTYTYTGSKDSRDWFRSTAAHNTVSVDGESSSVPAGPFSWTRIARTRCSSWISQPRFDFVDASHDGFSRLQSPATHWRSILFLRKDYWVIQDGVESDGRHRAQFWVHWDSGVPPVQIEENSIECADVLRISAFAGNGGWRREAGWVSHRYGMKKEAPVFSFSMESDGSASLTTFLLPRGASAKFPIVREVIATGGRAFEIDVQGKRDLLLLRHIHGTTVAPRVESSGIVSDFSLSWLRFDRTDSRPQECILIGGESLELDGKRLEIQQGASNGFYYVRN